MKQIALSAQAARDVGDFYTVVPAPTGEEPLICPSCGWEGKLKETDPGNDGPECPQCHNVQ